MLFVYGPYMPLRWLEEIRFWKTQEREHTVVIRTIVPGLEPVYASTLAAWEPVFGAAERAADQWIRLLSAEPDRLPPGAGEQTDALLRVSRLQSESFIRQLAAIREMSAAVRRNPVAPVVLDHIIRESQYFLDVIETAPGGRDLQDAARPGDAGVLTPHELGGGPLPPDGGSSMRMPDRVVPPGGHVLPPLPYPYDALEPHIGEETMRLHHDKHHRTYVDGLNQAEQELAKARQTASFELVKHWERELAFHGAGHYLHTLFWNVMSPKGGGRPVGHLADAIAGSFGSFDAFRKQFSAAAAAVEGSGWAILVWSPRSRRLEILTAEKHQNLSQWDVVPILPLDVWEHAYYLDYRNNRPAYIERWWKVVNWPYIQARLLDAAKLRWEPY